MANEKILILESAWSDQVDDTRATREIYASAETLLSIHEKPVRIIPRPLVSSTYLIDVEQFVSLPSNRHGPNLVIFSAHGSHSLIQGKNGGRHRRCLRAFDGEINISSELRKIKDKLGRTIFILDACEVGNNIGSFVKAAGALGAVGFCKDVSWIDSAVFILALLLRLQETGTFHMQRARKSSGTTQGRAQKVIEDMTSGAYKSLADSLGLEYKFAQSN